MRDYARISPQFWSGTTGRRLRGDPGGLTLAFYLMTCPTSTMSGLFYLPLPTISHETGLSLESTKRALERLEGEGFAFYEEETELVWVPEMARCQVGAELALGDNRIKGLLREVERSRRSRFYSAFFERYGSAYHLPAILPSSEGPSKPLRGAPETFSKGLRRRLLEANEAPSKGLARGFTESTKPLRSQDQDQEQDQEQEQKEIVAPASPSRPIEVEQEVPANETASALAERVKPEVDEPSPPLFRLEPITTSESRLSKPDEALQVLNEASNFRFVVTRLKRGQAICVQRLIAGHPAAAEWRLVGEWLAAGGEAWRCDVDVRCLGDFEAWLAHATKWRDSGRPQLHGRGARAPTALGYAPATTAYERSEDLTDDL